MAKVYPKIKSITYKIFSIISSFFHLFFLFTVFCLEDIDFF